MTETDVEKWTKAIVHLECQGYSTPEREGGRQVQSYGTGLLVNDAGVDYLVTARHVVHDPHPAIDGTFPGAESLNSQQVFSYIVAVPEFGVDPATRTFPAAMMNLSAGSLDSRPYLMSAPDYDLAVIDLSDERSSFIGNLITAGKVPVALSDVATSLPPLGEPVTAFGYPASVSNMAAPPLHPAEAAWHAHAQSLPTVSWGHVANRHPDVARFWADISIYPGNSGGPLVAGNQMVGVVCAQALVEGNRVPFANVVQSQLVRMMIDELKLKTAKAQALRDGWESWRS
ncbi:trypsin-like serine protease [Rhodococcus hoagii]|nr:trypsin-like serine protease [Prescottella equi]MBM4670129.1 trypsin-like serine protease [Prescottella equi]NKV87410.1 trypsin-like serine protease [Prescottella equi]